MSGNAAVVAQEGGGVREVGRPQHRFHAQRVAQLAAQGVLPQSMVEHFDAEEVMDLVRAGKLSRELLGLPAMSPATIFDTDYEGLGSANAVLALLDGTQVDDGTACEIGIMYGLMQHDPGYYKGIVGYMTDSRGTRQRDTGFGTRDGGGLDATLAAVPWPAVLGVVAAATMTLGNLVAIAQTNLKRLLAYSSIAHAGYTLMGLSANSALGVQGVMIYLLVYLIMNLGAFVVVIVVAEATGSESILDYKGLARRHPVAAVTFAIFLFSLTGINVPIRIGQVTVLPGDVVISDNAALNLGSLPRIFPSLDVRPDSHGLALWDDLSRSLAGKQRIFWVRVPDKSNDPSGILSTYLKENGCLDDVTNAPLPVRLYELRSPLIRPRVLPPALAMMPFHLWRSPLNWGGILPLRMAGRRMRKRRGFQVRTVLWWYRVRIQSGVCRLTPIAQSS